MLKWWQRSLALALGLLVSNANGGDNAWRVPPRQNPETGSTSASASTPAVTLGAPVPAPPAAAASPGALLGKPIPLTVPEPAAPLRLDGQLRPISFHSGSIDPPTVPRDGPGQR